MFCGTKSFTFTILLFIIICASLRPIHSIPLNFEISDAIPATEEMLALPEEEDYDLQPIPRPTMRIIQKKPIVVEGLSEKRYTDEV